MDEFQRIRDLQTEHIARYGWAVTGVYPDDPADPVGFTYTVGLTALDQPEFIIAGLGHLLAAALLNDIAAHVHDAGVTYHHGQRVHDLLAGYPACLIDGPATPQLWPGTAIDRYGPDRVRLRQIVWPDPDGHFPWQHGYRYPTYIQPLLGHP